MFVEKKSDRTSVAWYKLAVLIARREREKALNVYRLLSHSIEDRAYALQLEGDILWSFDDARAVEKYQQAAFLYKEEKKWVNAIAVCEHVFMMDSNNADVLGMLLMLYTGIDWQDRFQDRFKVLVRLFDKGLISEPKYLQIMQDLHEWSMQIDKKSVSKWVKSALDTEKKNLSDSVLNAVERGVKKLL